MHFKKDHDHSSLYIFKIRVCHIEPNSYEMSSSEESSKRQKKDQENAKGHIDDKKHEKPIDWEKLDHGPILFSKYFNEMRAVRALLLPPIDMFDLYARVWEIPPDTSVSTIPIQTSSGSIQIISNPIQSIQIPVADPRIDDPIVVDLSIYEPIVLEVPVGDGMKPKEPAKIISIDDGPTSETTEVDPSTENSQKPDNESIENRRETGDELKSKMNDAAEILFGLSNRG